MIRWGHWQSFIILLQLLCICFPIVQNWKGWNALHIASCYGHESLARDVITMYQLHPSTAKKVCMESCVVILYSLDRVNWKVCVFEVQIQ